MALFKLSCRRISLLSLQTARRLCKYSHNNMNFAHNIMMTNSAIFFVSFCMFLPFAHSSTAVSIVHQPAQLQYCSFFANRAPKIQLGLKNCTWFKENSCCSQQEIDAIFIRVKPLRGASPACQRYTNYLMCYICSPDQSSFYKMENLTVCEEFCDAWYDACQSAILKGSIIKGLYPNGTEFCNSRRFKTDTLSKRNCFFFDAKFDKSAAPTRDLLSLAHVLVWLQVSLMVWKRL